MGNRDLAIRTRSATAADGAGLIPLINAAFAIETFLEGTRTDEARLARMMETGTILVAEEAPEDGSGRLMGAIYSEIRAPEGRGRRGYLGMLAVDPAYQGRGLAAVLLRAAEDHFRGHGCEAIDITVLNMRPELPRIYRRYGFEVTGTEEFHPTQPLKVGVECYSIVMSKQL